MTTAEIVLIGIIAVLAILLFTRRDRGRRIGLDAPPSDVSGDRSPRPAPPQRSGSDIGLPSAGGRPRTMGGTMGGTGLGQSRDDRPPGYGSVPAAGTGLGRSRDDPPMGLSSAEHAEFNRALAAGRKIEAIKIVREGSGMGLKEAKEYVERLERAARGR